MTEQGHNSNQQLKAIVERIETVNEQINAFANWNQNPTRKTQRDHNI